LANNEEPDATPAVRLPFAINKSTTVSVETLTSLYHSSERNREGAFPLGIAAQFHCGTDLLVERGKPICAIARGEVVAARIGAAPGEHPWGDTGFVLLRHPLEDKKSIYSLFVNLRREPLHPDRTQAGWLKRLLLDAVSTPGKPKWRVMAAAPTWKDEDKGKFSSANVQKDKPLQPGVYEEEERRGSYVKLKGQWVKVSKDGKGPVKQLSSWVDFNLEAAAEKSQIVAALKDGKVAVLDADKKDGKHRWTVRAGEPIGVAGMYLGSPRVHWSVFSKETVFSTGSLPEKEFGSKDEVKLKELELSDERGDVEHTKKLIEALDPGKKTLGKVPQQIPQPGEVELFYRMPEDCWRSRYLAVKGLTEFALDVDKFLQQDRYKSHTDEEREAFKKDVKDFLFWQDLASADEFPADGKAIFVHPATALRLMRPAPPFTIEAKLMAAGGTSMAKERVRIVDPASGEAVGDPALTNEDGVLRAEVPDEKEYDIVVDDESPEEDELPSLAEHLGGAETGSDEHWILLVELLDADRAPLKAEKVHAKSEKGAEFDFVTDGEGCIHELADAGLYELTVRGKSFKAHAICHEDREGGDAGYRFVVS